MPKTAVLLLDCPDRKGIVAAVANFMVRQYDANILNADQHQDIELGLFFFARGVKLIGATSHYVTEVLDEGPSSNRTSPASPRTTSSPTLFRRGAIWNAWSSHAPSFGT